MALEIGRDELRSNLPNDFIRALMENALRRKRWLLERMKNISNTTKRIYYDDPQTYYYDDTLNRLQTKNPGMSRNLLSNIHFYTINKASERERTTSTSYISIANSLDSLSKSRPPRPEGSTYNSAAAVGGVNYSAAKLAIDKPTYDIQVNSASTGFGNPEPEGTAIDASQILNGIKVLRSELEDEKIKVGKRTPQERAGTAVASGQRPGSLLRM